MPQQAPVRVASEDDAHWWDGFGTADQAGLGTSYVLAMTVFQGKVVAGGYLTSAAGVPARRIAMWDGTSWSALGRGIDDFDCPEIECLGKVNALTVYDSSLVAGGNFPSVDGGLPASNIARWDGTRWHPLGSGMNGQVWALAIYGRDLVAGGSFTQAGGSVVNYVARWDGQEWHALGQGFNNGLHLGGLIVYTDDLVAAGPFTRAGQVEVRYLARWDGSTWGPIGGGVSDPPFALCILEDHLVVGKVSQAGGIEIYGMAQWDGNSWSRLGPFLFASVADCVDYNGRLVIGGLFTRPFGNRISQWTGTAWEPMGSGLDGPVFALVAKGSSLYAAGDFLAAGGKPSHRIARWDDVITPVLVQDLMVLAVESGLRLSWHLAAEAADGVIGVHVQRSEDSRGPFANRTAAPLEPRTAMSFEDQGVDLVASYWYRLVLLHRNGSETLVGPVQSPRSDSSRRGPEFAVLSSPGNPGPIQIRYEIVRTGTPVRLGIYDVLGRGLVSFDLGRQEPGTYLLSWDARNRSGGLVPSGVYVARLQAGQAAVAKKFVLVR